MLASVLMDGDLYSIRMHAGRHGDHLCGAERLVHGPELEAAAAALVRRALAHPRGQAESLRISIDRLDLSQIVRGRLPDVRTLAVADFHAGRIAALALLQRAGVAAAAAQAAMASLARGAAPGGVSMRGAMLVGCVSGRRFEPDRARGVRASRMDLAPAAAAALGAALSRHGLDNPQVREALVLAAKVLAAPGIVAELCWSDDPDYTTGYVAAPDLGYVRISELKPRGEERGGRAFFVAEDAWDPQRLLAFLQDVPFLAEDIGTVFPPGENL